MKSILHLEDGLEKAAQFSAKATGSIVALVMIGGLLAGWVLSEPIFRWFDRSARRAETKLSRQKPKENRLNGLGRLAARVIIFAVVIIPLRNVQAQSQTQSLDSATIAAPISKPTSASIWENGLGEGFKDGTQSISLSFGGTYGVRIFGGEERHDMELNSLTYGYMLGAVQGAGHWYQGNWEARGELFGGVQFSPSGNWVVGLTPHIRYNFATGTRWIPYLDLGAGVSATGIGAPDLSGTFEFNLQANTGVRWFIRDNLALTFEAGYLHLSDASISRPNLGVNALKGMIGVSWFF
jgi:lipid A 3-O-deacylase